MTTASHAHLLFVDDEPALRTLMAERLGERGFEVAQAESGERALQLLEQFAFDIIITDLRMPGIDGTHVIEAALERYPGIVGIVITGYGTVKDAVDAIKRGASDFIAKPFQFDELMHVLQKAVEQRRLKSENAYLRSQLEERYQFGGILGRSRPMRALFTLLETVSRSASTILITGETGTGKEVVRFIAATTSDLARMVAEGTFREDLYYRLNVIPMQLPPLRERRDDIPLLVTHFLEKFAPGTGLHVSQAAMRALMAYSWPGN